MFETSINAYLEANEPDLALEVLLAFLDGIEKADDFWFRDHVYQNFAGRVYASLERFKESEQMATEAFLNYTSLKLNAEEDYTGQPIPYSDWLSPSDAYILNHLALLLDQQEGIQKQPPPTKLQYHL